MKITKYIFPAVVMGASMLMVACGDDPIGPTIFPDESDDPDPASATYKFDTWLNRNFRDPYNMEFFYKFQDIESSLDYNLVPATYWKARDLALLTRYLWFDAYGELSSPEFLKQYGPRIIHLIGSPAYNPSSGTEILGLAEGGLKVSLFKVNEIAITNGANGDVTAVNIDHMNEYYFRTMHHEFGHILHQTKSYPTEFNELSTGKYDDASWQSKNPATTASLGMVTNYASSQAREDFAETIANFVTRTDEQMELILWVAGRGWSTGKEVTDIDDDDDDNKPYYTYYYSPTPTSTQRTYFGEYVDRPVDGGEVVYKMAFRSFDGSYCYSVAEIEASIAKLDAKLRNDYRKANNYDNLSASEKQIMDNAIKEMVFIQDVPDNDKVDGREVILHKQNIARTWFKDAWNLDFDKLREIVQTRQRKVDPLLNNGQSEINALRQEVENIK